MILLSAPVQEIGIAVLSNEEQPQLSLIVNQGSA